MGVTPCRSIERTGDRRPAGSRAAATPRSGSSGWRSSAGSLAWSLVNALATVLALSVVAAFFAVVLTPAVDLLERRTLRRGLATLAVFVVGVLVFGALGYAFARPVYDSSSSFTRTCRTRSAYVEHGRGEVGHWLKDIGAQKWAHDNLPKLRKLAHRRERAAAAAGKTVLTGSSPLVTILVLTFLMLMEGPEHRRVRPRPLPRAPGRSNPAGRAPTRPARSPGTWPATC